MNIEKWIYENSFELDDQGECIDVSDLRQLLKTHAIVPIEPSDKIINEGIDSQLVRIGTIRTRTYLSYKAMVKASELE